MSFFCFLLMLKKKRGEEKRKKKKQDLTSPPKASEQLSEMYDDTRNTQLEEIPPSQIQSSSQK